ncbi:MAG: diguanylate cyclase [Gammaproteobacteria bacterium]
MTLDLPKVLVVDDEKSNRALLAEVLKDRYKVILAKDGEMALEMAARHQPDLVLLDVVMPGMGGHEVLRRLKSRDETRQMPVIFISALDSVEDEEKGLLLGAADYITKPFHAPVVRARIQNHAQAVSHRRLLEQLALVDALTEIPNRRRLENAMRWRAQPEQWISLIMVDVDCFKLFNDYYGHAIGDRALCQVARTLQRLVQRETDLVARYGGEEFVLFLPCTDPQGGRAFAELACQAVRDLAIPHASSAAGGELSISLGGASTFLRHGGPAPPELLTQSDAQLYRAKQSGRNRVCWG